MRKIFNTLFDVVTGFDLNKELKRVMEMDFWDRDSIEKYQQEKFEELRKYALRTEIYKDHKTTEYANFPLYSKDYVQQYIESFRSHQGKPYRTIYTSGSTGNPKKILVSKAMLQAKRVSHLKMLNWYNIKREAKELHIGGLTQPFAVQVYHFLKNKVYLPSNNITWERAWAYIRAINRNKPKILFAYPFALDLILSYAELLKEKLYQPVVVYTGGENLKPEIKAHIQQHFPDSKIVND